MIGNKLSGCLLLVGAAFFTQTVIAQTTERAPLYGHVLPALTRATSIVPWGNIAMTKSAGAPLALTLVLRRSDPEGFERYLEDVYDPRSPQFRKFMTPAEVTQRFGPSQDDYAAVTQYFEQQGFALDAEPANRMTMMVRGTRADAARALSVNINDYRIGDKSFYANDGDPALPADIAAKIEAVIGLSNLAVPTAGPAANPMPAHDALAELICRASEYLKSFDLITNGSGAGQYAFNQTTFDAGLKKCMKDAHAKAYASGAKVDPPPPAWQGADGTGQTVGIVAFDTFDASDVSNYIAASGLPAAKLGDVTSVHVGGGAIAGANQSEVLLDIDTILADAPGARIVVYDAPFNVGSFQGVFNAMINGGVNIISNSWAYCEDQTTLADVQSIDTILQTGAASGIGAFSGSGDRGSTCLDGKPATTHVPATSPHVTAVGGTSLTVGHGFTYAGETWWDGSSASPPTGQGGFGVSKFFGRPAYQNGQSLSVTRSIPDVSAHADPADGVLICQASAGGCPAPLQFGGTSRSAPAWAAFAALLNQTQGSNLGFLNPLLYALAGSDAFHTPASMGSDFAHVGLGSPNLARLHQHLTSQVAGAVDSSVSDVSAYSAGNELWVPNDDGLPLVGLADGTSPIYVVVRLADALGNTLSGKTVTLNATGSAIVTPASGISNVENGAVIFKVTNLAFETVTFTATANPGNVVLAQLPTVVFVPPFAASASISAGPSNVQNDGVATTTITVTIQDGLGRPSPGKRVVLSQGGGNSVINGPSPSVTNASGTIQFTATDHHAETVTYTAVDVSDGNLAVPGSAVVTFGGQANNSCAQTSVTAAAGYTLTPFATGFAADIISFGNVNWGCRGASFPAFGADGSVYINDFLDGGVFKLPPAGGAASSSDRISTLGPTLIGSAIGKDGRIYAARGATTGDFTTGAIYELDPTTGGIIRTVLGNLTCPTGLGVDPLSGDLFFSDSCFGAGSDNPSLWRVANPAGPTPTLSVYTTLAGTPTGWIAIAPDGTIFMPQTTTSASGAPVLRISGTNIPGTPSQTPVPGLLTVYWITVGEVLPDGSAKSLIVLAPGTFNLKLADITTNPPTYTDLTVGGIGSGVIGPDGCLYTSAVDTVYKLAPSAGGCGFSKTSHAPQLVLSPETVSPDPTQGSQFTFTAKFTDASVPSGTPVSFVVLGANTRTLLAATDATGAATVTYTGAMAGTDTVTSFGTASGMALTSNPATVTWSAGKHLSFIALNTGPSGSAAGQSVTLQASLADISLNPPAVIAGAAIHFTLGSQSCDGVTNGNGVASCNVIPPLSGQFSMTATYAGSVSYTPSTASQAFSVAAAAGGPTPMGVVARKVHGAAGTFDLPLSVVVTNPTTEPRTGPTHTIVFTFDSAVTAATATITEGTATAGTPTFSGNDVVVGLTGVTDQQYVTVTLSAVATASGPGSGSVRIGFLRGDVNQNRVVTVADLGLVNAQLAQFVTQTNYLKDVNASGTLTVADKGLTNANLTRALPAP
jgi:Pro-kumamolisin, activation domain/Bacterial Ig-like domain (group 1)